MFNVVRAGVSHHGLPSACFIVVCGLSEDSKPWVSLGAPVNKELSEIFMSMNDLKKLEDFGAKLQCHTLTNTRDQTDISVVLEEAKVNGVSMYCIDIKLMNSNFPPKE
jgi:hypothetical protein